MLLIIPWKGSIQLSLHVAKPRQYQPVDRQPRGPVMAEDLTTSRSFTFVLPRYSARLTLLKRLWSLVKHDGSIQKVARWHKNLWCQRPYFILPPQQGTVQHAHRSLDHVALVATHFTSHEVGPDGITPLRQRKASRQTISVYSNMDPEVQ